MEAQPIGQTSEVRKYQMNKQMKYSGSTPSGRLSKKPPVILPEEMPRSTMFRILKVTTLDDSGEYKIIMGHLKTYQKKAAFQSWEEYRKSIPEDMAETMKEIFIECRRNGFVNPHVRNDQIIFDQVIAQGSCGDTDPCTMCGRECRIREGIDTGEIKRQRAANGPGYKEPRLCWQREGDVGGYSGERIFQGTDTVKVRYKSGSMAGRTVKVSIEIAEDLIKRNKAENIKEAQ
jgi:hypothetical protein